AGSCWEAARPWGRAWRRLSGQWRRARPDRRLPAARAQTKRGTRHKPRPTVPPVPPATVASLASQQFLRPRFAHFSDVDADLLVTDEQPTRLLVDLEGRVVPLE